MNDYAVSVTSTQSSRIEWKLMRQTFHLHHAGRALYTLIQPTAGIPIVRRVVMGANISKGEVTQLFVPGGWWKASEIPDEDMLLLDSPCTHDLRERLGCLISEVVVPGWDVDQHQFLTKQKVGRRTRWPLSLSVGDDDHIA